MKLSSAAVLIGMGSAHAFTVSHVASRTTGASSTFLQAEIRPKTEKAKVLEFGWDGSTALGGAVDNSKPARMLDAIRAAGETQSSACELFNANLGTYFWWKCLKSIGRRTLLWHEVIPYQFSLLL